MSSMHRLRFITLAGKAVATFALPLPLRALHKNGTMNTNKVYDVIIIGGSYSGLAAGMALGRARKHVLIIDSGLPCNRQTPHSHNFLTQDGSTPAQIAKQARRQVMQYDTVEFLDALVTGAHKTGKYFEVTTKFKSTFRGRKLIFATGIRDIMPDIPGFTECWGISVLHCPYCHGYEVKEQATGILVNGEQAYELAQLISNWTHDLTIYTNGAPTLTERQASQLTNHNIRIIEKKISKLQHTNGQLKNIAFDDKTKSSINALYTKSPFEQHCKVPESLGCELNAEGYLKVDPSLETTVPGVYACGDNINKMRTVANAVAMGTTAGMIVSKKLIFEEFEVVAH